MELDSVMTPYSYRADPSVSQFDDSAPIVIFDGMCVLCSDWRAMDDGA